MDKAIILNIAYIVAAVLFVFGIKMLGSATTARRGNMISSIGMLLAVVATLFDQNILTFQWIIIGLIAGAVIGALAARLVKMTEMPELVALLNGFGGASSLLVGWADYAGDPDISIFTGLVVFLAIFIGGMTFTGSVIAWGKLSGKLSGSPTTFAGQAAINVILILVTIALGIAFAVMGEPVLLYIFLGSALLLGVMTVIPIGGGDMPVVISLLNSMSGLAACAAGFVLENKVLVVAGCLVGASGLILTIIMCKAMNRTLLNVIIGGFGTSGGTAGAAAGGEMKAMSVEDAYFVLEAANKVIFIPGYGMAVAQAQHVVKELSDLLEDRGCEVGHAIHPVAGRMPGHMNVLLAEADVEYEQLLEMEQANAQLPITDVAIVIGANDVVNPAATDEPGSPIYGMPIVNAHHARTVFCLKRGQGAGFSGLVNKLFVMDNTRMIYGDAKKTIGALVTEFKNS